MQTQILVAVVVAAAALAAAPAAAQQSQLDGHADYQRTNHSHTSSWGAGANLGLSFGGQNAPVKLNPSVGADYLKQEGGDQKQLSANFDLALQVSVGPLLSPYVGGSVSSNWSSTGDGFGGAHLGLQYIVGTQLKLQADAPYALIADWRPGYVRGQEHSSQIKFGVQFSM